MKVNKLQIGDYVNYRGQIIKVTSLYDKGDSNEIGWSRKESVWVNADNVEPIPLTAEILERNGFVYNDLPFAQCWEQYGLRLYHSGDGYAISCGIDISMIIVYVHQLQQALRLCGIEKEIEL